ncbi:MAG TPA: hypothetical protein VFT66_06095 [Roseiflexaceae bacterium]|jgi:hypothetical protein|nr:hypothetical protein [Roseiflexaceae bacterium]
MNQFSISNLHFGMYQFAQPPIEHWDQLQPALCLLILLVVGNVALIVVAMFLRRRLNDIEATRPPSRRKRGKADASSDEPAAQPHDQFHS